MSHYRGLLISAIAVLVAGGLFTAVSNAQEGRPPRITSQPVIQPRAVVADWHLLHAGNSTYRFNSRNGETQSLNVVSQSVGIGYVWTPASEGAGAPKAGENGRYEVAQGDNSTGFLIRIDTNFGTTWIGNIKSGTLVWELAK